MNFSRDFEERHYQIPEYLTEINTQFGKAIMRVATAAEKLYIDGVNIFDIVKHRFLVDMYNFTKYGLCYEAAAIAMMLLKGNSTARLVLGTGEYRHITHERCNHAWVEFEEDGVPFAIDFAWFDSEFCIPRIVHVDACKSIVYRTYDYNYFWQMPISQRLYRLCHDRKTSYIMPWLSLYRSIRREYYDLSLVQLSKCACCSDFAPTGEYRQFMYFLDLFFKRLSWRIFASRAKICCHLNPKIPEVYLGDFLKLYVIK